jgi:hypothetical protein
MKAYGSGCTDPRFLDLGTSWRWVVNFTPRPLYPRGKRPGYPLDRRLGGPQSRSGRFGEEKNSWPCRDSNPDPSVVHPVASPIIIEYTTKKKTLFTKPTRMAKWFAFLPYVQYGSSYKSWPSEFSWLSSVSRHMACQVGHDHFPNTWCHIIWATEKGGEINISDTSDSVILQVI